MQPWQSTGGLALHLRSHPRPGTPVAQRGVLPPGAAASAAGAAEALQPRGKLVMVPAHLVGKKAPMPLPAGTPGGSSTTSRRHSLSEHPAAKLAMTPPLPPMQAFPGPSRGPASSSAASVSSRAPLAQHAKKQMVPLSNVQREAAGQPRAEARVLLEHAPPGSHGVVSPRPFSAPPTGGVQPVQQAFLQAQSAGAPQPLSSGSPGKKHRSGGSLLENMTLFFRGKTGKKPSAERAAPRKSYAKGGALPVEPRPGAGAAQASRTAAAAAAAAAATPILDQSAAGRAGGEQFPSWKGPPQQQQQQQQQRQQLYPTSTFVDGDGRATAQHPGDRPGLSPLPTLAVETQRATPVSPTVTPLVVSPTVSLRNEAGEAGIAPSSSVQVAKEGEEVQRRSQQARRVALFPSFAIVDSDEDSEGSAETSQRPNETRPPLEADAGAQAAAEAPQAPEEARRDPSSSSAGAPSPSSQLVTQQGKDEETSAQTASTRLHVASDGPRVSPEAAVGKTDAKPPKGMRQPVAAVPVSSGPPPRQTSTAGSYLQKPEIRQIRLPQQTDTSSTSSTGTTSCSMSHHSDVRGRGAQQEEEGKAEGGEEDLSQSRRRTLPPARKPSSPVGSRKPSGNDKAGGTDKNAAAGKEEGGRRDDEAVSRGRDVCAANGAHDNGRWRQQIDRRGSENEADGERRKLLSPPSSRSLHSHIFHTQDVYKLYQELKRQQHAMRRERFSRWRAHDTALPEAYSRTHRRIGGRSPAQSRGARQPWRSSSFHPSPLPPASPLRRPLGCIGVGVGYVPSAGGEASDVEAVCNEPYASSRRCSPYRSLLPSRLASQQRAGTPPAQRRPWSQQCETREYSPNHPYEVVSLFPPRNFDESHRGDTSANAGVRGNGTVDAGRASGGGDNTPLRVHAALGGHGANAANSRGGPKADVTTTAPHASLEKKGETTPQSPSPRHPNHHHQQQQQQRGAYGGRPASATPRRQRGNSCVRPSVGSSSPHARRPQSRSVVRDLTVRSLRRCCSEGGSAGYQVRTTGWRANMTNTGQWLDEVVAATLGGERAGSAASRALAGRLPVPVVDLRTDFKPCLDPPLRAGEVIGGEPNRRVRRGVNYSASTNRSNAHTKGSGAPQQGAASPHRRGQARSTSPRRTPDDAAATARSSQQRRIVDVPPFPPLKMYSSFDVKEPDRPSAWAVGPERSNLLADSPTARRRIVKRTHSGEQCEAAAASDGGRPVAGDATAGRRGRSVVLVEEVRLDEQRRPYVVIREVPRGAAAVEAQKTSVNRLSRPRPVYVRPGNGDAR
ncbi:uncharacterized protein Tco025E_04935 [Trypanosoma conorhini]|uniref:Uncharacterized protein n=1 Tax=Trypanosoma conorhini TaxID=83891 RepID=A0A422PHT8_9TRYP|nr:uncharacterized protein Tco025E_04935 [Trypanosoma conorhini]RNF17257.1 hypothetical protein Tco025E_04935 [Trypanosoma conorhini]